MRYAPHILAALLLIAWAPMPYGYYMVLRLAVTCYAIYQLVQHASKPSTPDNKSKELYIILAAGIAILYQPVFKAPFDKSIWCWINLATIPLLYVLSWSEIQYGKRTDTQ